MIENLFAHRISLLGVSRNRLQHLITQPEARKFGHALAIALARPVVFHDEGLTSWAAEEDVKAAGKRLKDARRSGEVDRRAAIAILRSWLQSCPSGS